MPEYAIRQAKLGDCAGLSALAFRSKAHWGYDSDFMENCRAELTVTAGHIADGLTWLAERDGVPLGFYGLDIADPETLDVSFLFVEPALIGQGIGGALFYDMVARAAARGYARMTIAADPQAEGFYLRMGAQRIGTCPSDSIAGRSLPLFEYGLP